MSDNPQAAPAQQFRLPGHAVLSIEGRDAVAFAQAQCMNEVVALPVGAWQWNGWLTPKGRVVALFALLKLDPQTLWLLLPDADADGLAAQLQRYVFRSRLALSVPALPIAGGFAPARRAQGQRIGRGGDGAIELDLGGDGGPRRLVIGGAPAHADGDAQAGWDQADLVHGLPRLPADQAELWTPQQLSLDRLQAYSVKKGCYPGQEIVARTHFLGQAKRGLALLHADAPVAAGTPVEAEGHAIGSVVSARDRTLLAVVAIDAAPAALQAGGIALSPSPLLGGLAR